MKTYTIERKLGCEPWKQLYVFGIGKSEKLEFTSLEKAEDYFNFCIKSSNTLNHYESFRIVESTVIRLS